MSPVSWLYTLARLANDIRHLIRGSILMRLWNKLIGRQVGKRIYRKGKK